MLTVRMTVILGPVMSIVGRHYLNLPRMSFEMHSLFIVNTAKQQCSYFHSTMQAQRSGFVSHIFP